MVMPKPPSQQVPLVRPTKFIRNLEVSPSSLLVFSPYDLKLASSALPAAPKLLKTLHLSSLFDVQIGNMRITLAGPAIGAPLACMVLEVLISFGSRHILALGSCGSLNENLRVGNVVIPDKAFPDEGTSSHYPLRGKTVSPSARLVSLLKAHCQASTVQWTAGSVWTTDAPFRETPERVKKFQLKKALAVEMELSAFFKVCAFYGVEGGAILVVSDELASSKWISGYRTTLYRDAFTTAAKIAFEVLSRLGKE